MKNKTQSIRRIVSYLNDETEDGGFWLPNIQRPFVWNEEQIERLFDSIMRQYPISTLLVWRTNSKIRRRKFLDNYRYSIRLSDFYVPEDTNNKNLILDGQQRLQSLFIGLRGSYENRELYFDVLSGDITPPEDMRYNFRFLPPSKVEFPWVKFKDLVFTKKSRRQVSDYIRSTAPETLSDAEDQRIEDNVDQIFRYFVDNESIVYQELDSIDDPDAYTEDDIVEIFIRANSGGTKLGKSDLLFSLLIVAWEDANERMDEILEQMNRTGYEFTRDFILKTCLTLLDKGPRYEVGKFRDQTTRDAIMEQWPELAGSILSVKDFLYGKTFIRSDKALPSYLVLIPLIYFRHHFPDSWKSTRNIDTYILRCLLTGAFSGTPDNLIDRIVRHVKEHGKFSVNEIFGIIREDGRALEIGQDHILGLQYGSKDIHLIFNLWYRDFNYIPSYEHDQPQIDHIFPQSLLRSVKEINPDTGRRNLLRYRIEDRDQIANCMLLTAEENGAGGKGDTPPEVWFSDKSEEYLDMHLIPKNPELWKLEKYEDFIEERKKLILARFNYMLHKEHD